MRTKRNRERKKNLYVYTYIGHTTGKTTFMSIQYETNVRKQCVFCNRTFHPKRINGEPLIKLCSICAQISAFSNTRSHIDWIIDKLLAQTITRMLGKSTTEIVHLTTNNMLHFKLHVAKKYICYNHIPSEEFLIRKVNWETSDSLCRRKWICLRMFMGVRVSVCVSVRAFIFCFCDLCC